VGEFEGRFQGSLQAIVPVMGYGISDHAGVYVAVPVIKLKAQFATAFQPSEQYSHLAQNWSASGNASMAANLQGALDSGFETKIKAAGYKYEPSSDRSSLGDIQVLSPLLLSGTGDRFQYGCIQSISLPTGEVARPDDLYGVGSGSGRWAVGSSAVASYQWGEANGAGFRWSATFGGQLMMPARLAKRIPREEGDVLSPDVDSNVQVSFSPTLKAGTEWKLGISRSWSGRLGYTYQMEASPQFSGTQFGSERYRLLSQKQTQDLHTFQVGVDLALVQAFLDGDFLLPASFGFSAAIPVGGRNTLSDTMYLVQAAFFF
jgi:hypothetical protein